jgi:hypothetical protein
MRASAAIDDHQGAFWGGHLNAGGVATITNCVSPGSGKRAPSSPELDLHTRRINAHSDDRTCQARPLPMLVCGPIHLLTFFSFVHPLRRVPERSDSRMLNALLANGADGSRATTLRQGYGEAGIDGQAGRSK